MNVQSSSGRPVRRPHDRNALLAAALAATLALIVVVGAPGRAVAEPAMATPKPTVPVGIESLSATDRARMLEQEPYLRLNDKLHELAARWIPAHFAGSRLDLQRRALVVYWAGELPAAVKQLRADAAAKGVSLIIEEARFSQDQLMRASEEIGAFAEQHRKRLSIELHSDGSGLTVAADDLPAITRGARTATAAEAGLVRQLARIQAKTGVPISVTDPPAAQPTFDSRAADYSPYWAGALIKNSVKACTSGFSMYATGSPARFTLTAAHCGRFRDGTVTTNGAGVQMGFTDFIHEMYDVGPSYDLGVIRLDTGKTNQPYIYVREYTGEGKITVGGYASGGIVYGGNYCVNGYLSRNCNIIAKGTVVNCTDWPPTGRCVYTVAATYKDFLGGPYAIWCRGDSGGPIYYWSGNKAIASGVVSWGYEEVGNCSYNGGMSVVASAVARVDGLAVLTG